jgi:Fe-S-cluster containining protein
MIGNPIYNIERLAELAKNTAGENENYFRKLKKKKPGNLDDTVSLIHHDVFNEVDCLLCANCCKTISPVLKNKDIDRIAKRLRMKPSEVVAQYLEIDEEDDYVFREQPCPFLMDDNYCLIYEDRPRACREYPHTDRRKFHQILNITLKNTEICPAVFMVIERLKKELPR